MLHGYINSVNLYKLKLNNVILVTGGTGLVGSHLLFDLCRSGKHVRALKRSNSNIDNVKKVFLYYTSAADELLKNIEWVESDLLDVYSLMESMDGITEVYHCAAMVSFDQKDEAEMMSINLDGTANMVNAALEKGVRKFCHVSSIASLGRAATSEFTTEETFWKSSPDHSNYAISKYAAEREVWRASEEGLDVIIVNPSLIVGAGNWEQSSAKLFTKGYRGMKYYTAGANGFIDVRDVSGLMVLLMNSKIKNQRFLLSAENWSYQSFFDLMHKEFSRPAASFKIGKLLSSIALGAERLRTLLFKAKPFITEETVRSAHRIGLFSNKKIKLSFPDYQFISIERSVKEICKLYLREKAPL